MLGSNFDREIMCAVIMTVSPEGIKQHLQVNASAFDEDYDQMKDIIIGYLRSKRS